MGVEFARRLCIERAGQGDDEATNFHMVRKEHGAWLVDYEPTGIRN